MRKIWFVLLTSTAFLFNSCKNELDLKPFDQVETSLAFEKPSDFTNAILGAYTGFQSGSYYGGSTIILPDVLADNLILCRVGRFSQTTFYRWQYSSNSTWYIWDAAYVVIMRCNLILENLDNLPDGAFKANVEAEAKAMRALAHFDIVRVYGKMPTQGGALGLGVPYMTSSDVTLLPSRNTVEEVYAAIAVDFESAKANINEDNGNGRLNKNAVNGLLSRLYLYMGEWQKCVDAAQACIDGDNVQLASIDNFYDMWDDNNTDEVLFKISNTFIDGISLNTEYSQTVGGAIKSEYVCDYAFYLQFADNDVRKGAYIVTEEYPAFSGVSYNHINKYLGRNAFDPLDTKVLRTAEVYLNKAEAEFELGLESDALNDLDALRTQRYFGYIPLGESGPALKAAIRQERRLELAFEGHRFFDLKRWGLKVERSDFGDIYDGTGTPVEAQYKTLNAGDFKFQLPVAVEETNVNKNITQNPGF